MSAIPSSQPNHLQQNVNQLTEPNTIEELEEDKKLVSRPLSPDEFQALLNKLAQDQAFRDRVEHDAKLVKEGKYDHTSPPPEFVPSSVPVSDGLDAPTVEVDASLYVRFMLELQENEELREKVNDSIIAFREAESLAENPSDGTVLKGLLEMALGKELI